jgi:hypothetical protein
MNRSRTKYLIAAGVVVVLGLCSRRYSRALPEFVATYAGDTLWALTAFLGLGALFPRWPTRRVCAAALLFSFAVELSQLYHSPWIDRIRHTRVGGMILGYGFLWSDLLCYSVGVCAGFILETALSWINSRRARAGWV